MVDSKLRDTPSRSKSDLSTLAHNPPPPHVKPVPEASATETSPANELRDLRQSLSQMEQSLYKTLSTTPNSRLNEVRRKFRVKADQAQKKLETWQVDLGRTGHADLEKVGRFDAKMFQPDWWLSGHHLMPNSRIIVREKDWGSIVAYTLR